jgi:V/A-type H+/Na+-transporting ATPase subunit I
MITEVNKYLIFGMKEDLDLFCQRAQNEGCIEFVSGRKSMLDTPEPIQSLMDALSILKQIPYEPAYLDDWNVQEVIDLATRVTKLKGDLENFYEEKRLLTVEIARISPFGDFYLEDLAYLEEKSHYKMQFFCAKAGKADSLLVKDELFYVATEYDLDYFISISPEPKNYPPLIEMRIDRSLGELRNQLTYVDESIHFATKELKKLSGYRSYFQEVLLGELNAHHLAQVKADIRFPMKGSTLFSVEAWIPKTCMDQVISLLDGLAVHCEQIKVEDSDRVPTAMENTGASRLGEDLVRFYDTPSVTDKDPSGWVFWSFALFFAFIVADGGYGLVYLALAAYLKWKWKSFQGTAKRMFRLFVVLSCFVVGWGIFTGAFFGIEIAPSSVLKKISPFQKIVAMKAEYHLQQKDDVYQEWLPHFQGASVETGEQFIQKVPQAAKEFSDNVLLEIALIMGIVHIAAGLLRSWKRSYAGIGWAAFLVGAYLFFPSTLNATTLVNIFGLVSKEQARALGEQILPISILLALTLALVQKKWKGILEVMNVIQVSGDVLSYLRLYALALASSIMAITFNEMGGAVGLVGGALIILAGHLTNISLSTMSGVIHGLRLNFIEWYHYAFEGGGRIFNPLRLLRIKKN